MYNYLKEKFSISDDKINDLINYDQDIKDLFTDYEEMCIQLNDGHMDCAMFTLHIDTIIELEDEIFQVLANHNFQNN